VKTLLAPASLKLLAVLAILWAIALSLRGCTLLGAPVAEKVAEAVNRYRAEPYQSRLLLRETVNAQTGSNRISVYCEGDPNSPE
jgi:hypothetical protein